MIQQHQLRRLFKYMEEQMDTAVSSNDAKQIKQILGGILLDEPEPEPEPDQDTGQVTDQDKPKFDQDRFEAMFRAVVASGRHERWEQKLKSTKFALEQLDAFYASTKGGENE